MTAGLKKLTDNFEYDVAFSFHAQDESIATQLNDLVADRMKTFLYSERQRDIAGTDGLEKFSEVYGKSARLVVVLYRPEWGETPWTRVEQEAIRQRAFNSGWDFTTFIPTIDNPQMPQWLPRTRLYFGLNRFGVVGAASVIDARVSELGGNPKSETIAERTARFSRSSKLREQQRNFLNSASGVQAANLAYEEFTAFLEKSSQTFKSNSITLKVQRSGEIRIVSGIPPINLIAEFRPFYSNVLEGVYLTVDYYKGFPEIPGYVSFGQNATKLRKARYSYEMVGIDRFAYIALDEKRREFSPQFLGEHVLKTYLDIADKNPLKY